MNRSNNKQFSRFFFVNLFISLVASMLIFFLFIKFKAKEDSSIDYFSKVLTNFGVNFEKFVYNDYIQEWFNPNLKSDEQEEFQKYKLSILAKTLNTFFKNLLVETQNQIVDNNLQNFIIYKKSFYLDTVKSKIKQHIYNNPDLREVTIFDIEGNKIFGFKYKDSPNYTFSGEIIEDVLKNKNLLVKQGDNNDLILLSTIENNKNSPFLIISQLIDKNFFNRILKHLEIDDDIFYIKDSKNLVLFDNQDSNKNLSESPFQYKIYNTLTSPQEEGIKINLNNISYSLGTIVQKNNIVGNVVSIGFVTIIFLTSFFCIDMIIIQLRKFFWNRRALEEPSPPSLEPVLQEVHTERNDLTISSRYRPPISSDLEDDLSSKEIKPLTLEQYLLKEKNKISPND